MKFISIFFESLLGFISRNPLTCAIIVVLAVAFPTLFNFMAGAFILLVVVAALSLLLLLWRLRSVRKSMEREFREAAGGRYDDGTPKEEGDVSVHRTTAVPQKKIKDDVGEYVDFEEEKSK